MIDHCRTNLSNSQGPLLLVTMKAAIFGAGCWASQYEPGPIDGMACSISG